MDEIKTLRDVLSKCRILLDGEVISNEPICNDYWVYLCSCVEKSKFERNLILHTGSVIYDAVLLCFSALYTVLHNNVSNSDVVEGLNKGDLVIYRGKDGKGERYRFEEIRTIDRNKYAYILQDGVQKGKSCLVPQKMWANIRPYFGESNSLDGKGIKAKSKFKSLFYKLVLEKEESNIVGVSSVIVTSKKYYERLFDGISFVFSGNKVFLSELVEASFFTDSNEIRHSGNVENVNPVLKFTSSIEYARKQFAKSNREANCLLVFLSEELIRQNITQYISLMEKRKIERIFTSVRIDSDLTNVFGGFQIETKYYAVTKEVAKTLIEKWPIIQEKNELTKRLRNQILNASEHSVECVEAGQLISVAEYRFIKQALSEIIRDDFSSNDKDDFVASSYFL